MKALTTIRGFRYVEHPQYPVGGISALIQESSAVGDYDDALDRPGSSFLWVGDSHHLDRDEVRQLAAKLQGWLDTGRIPLDEEER